jgi:hypothetical protein
MGAPKRLHRTASASRVKRLQYKPLHNLYLFRCWIWYLRDQVSPRECSCIGFFALNTHDLCCSSRLSHTHTTSLCRLFPVRRERDNLSTLLLSHPLRFRFKTRGDVKLNYMCHNILRSSRPTCGPSFRYRLSWSARRESKQADFHPETAKEGSTGFTRDLSHPR